MVVHGASRLRYLRAVEMLVNVVLRLDPRLLTTVMIAIGNTGGDQAVFNGGCSRFIREEVFERGHGASLSLTAPRICIAQIGIRLSTLVNSR